ncbi:zinc finger protein 606 isoform X3 [Loxodonta africana]|uniref:zinc finger protein 606 isoform X3 n=1 Tax=Loxodonta africana TaxID=9785 RepID=UPI0030D1CABB
MAAINPWASWGALMDQSWGMAAISPWASWAESTSCIPIACRGVASTSSDLLQPEARVREPALYPRDPAWPVEGTPEEERRTGWLPTYQVQSHATINMTIFQNIFIIPERKETSCPLSSHLPFSLPQPLVTTNLPFVSLDLPLVTLHMRGIP